MDGYISGDVEEHSTSIRNHPLSNTIFASISLAWPRLSLVTVGMLQANFGIAS
jgi:hypothetical protein